MSFRERRPRQVSLRELSSVEVKFHLADCLTVSYEKILVVEFLGEYRIGSAGAPDAQFMTAMSEAGLAAWEPGAVILDLRSLAYEWGDNLEEVFSIGSRMDRLAIACVVGPNCEEAVRTLVLGINSTETIDTVGWIFRDLEAATAHVDELLRQQRNADEVESTLRRLKGAEERDPDR